ncbi:MAG: 7-carboxy-7-deazaguanine synthase QueE [Methylovulum sp.]
MLINEQFYSIQTEGYFAGTPADFIRLQGCSVGCTWCDTKHSWSSKKGVEKSVAEIIGDLKSIGISNHVIITGGEPLEQDLSELILALISGGYFIAIETSGTEPLQEGINWITCSPKNFKKKTLDSVLSFADELKFIYTDESDEEFIMNSLRKTGAKHAYIQPNYDNQEATQKAVEYCKKTGFKLSLQMHKYIEIE